MTRILTAGILCLAALSTAGCVTSGHIVVRGSVPPPVVVSDPVVIVDDVDVDYWYDGSRYYYLESGTGLYFYWVNGARFYCNRGWYPTPAWHHHDRYWRNNDHHYRPPVYRPQPPRGPVHIPDRGPTRGPDRGPDRGHDGRGNGGWNNGGWNNGGDHRGGDHRGGGDHGHRGGRH